MFKKNERQAQDYNLGSINKSDSSFQVVKNLVPGMLHAGEDIEPGTLHQGEDDKPWEETFNTILTYI